MPRKSRSLSNKKKSSRKCRTKRCSNKKGGSLASNKVMNAVHKGAPGKLGYKTDMHLPPMEELKGGSRASDRLSSYMSDKSTEPRSELLQSNEFASASMDGFKTQTYELSGGSNCKQQQEGAGVLKDNLVTLIEAGRKNPNVSAKQMVDNYLKGMPMRNKLTITQLVAKKSMKGGNGFLSNVGCGPVNVPDAGRKYASNFSKTSSCPGPEWYANPPNLGSAGSGMEDMGVGAPAL